MKIRMIIMLIIVAVILGGVFGFGVFKNIMIKKYMASQSAPPQTVSTMEVKYQEWKPLLSAVGTLRAARGVDISNELEGVVSEIHFDSGADVIGGDLLVQLNAADDIAKLQSLQAASKLAEITYRRDLAQLKVQAVSKQQVDIDAATLASDKAQVAQQQALVDKKSIRAPFSGHVGIRNVDLGQYLNPGTVIVTLQQLDPMYLDFFLPQQDVAKLQPGQPVTAATDAYPGRPFSGKVLAVNPKVDASTRNVQVRAEIANPDHALLPGMYATAKIEVGSPQKYLTLPQTAISYNPYGDTVFLAERKSTDENNKNENGGQPQYIAKQTFVTLGDTRGDQVAIVKGIKEGDIVVTSGQIKLQNDTPLHIDNSVQPTNEANPVVKDE